jgi:mono/diheme cytochrome c family protein
MQKTKNPHLPLRSEPDWHSFLSLRERIEVRALWQTSFVISALILCLTVGCETANYAPSVRSTSNNAAQLERGRRLFVHRCIECHTLPAIWHYTPKDWTEIVNSMSHRASLKPAERDAVIAYILAVRATDR